MRIMVLPINETVKMALHDLTVYSRDDRPVLIVEVRAGKESAPEQLERIRQALVDSAETIEARYCLLAQRNGIFLWKKNSAAGERPEPASIKSVLHDYAASLADPEQSLRKDGLEIVMHSWLDDLALGIRMPKSDSEADQLLVRTGIYSAIRDGRVVTEI